MAHIPVSMGDELDDAADKLRDTADEIEASAERAKTLEAVIRLRGIKIAKMVDDIDQIKQDINCDQEASWHLR